MASFAKLSRRDLLRLSTLGAVGFSSSGWLEALASDVAGKPPKRACILLWMTGGPSQMDTFDLKPGHANGGTFKEIQTAVPGIRISEHLPGIAKHADRMAIIRSMTTKEGDHGRATFLVRAGYLPQGPIRYPTLGSLVAKELGNEDAEIPNFVSINPNRAFSPAAYGPGFLGARFAPLIVGDSPLGRGAEGEQLKVEDLAAPEKVTSDEMRARLELLQGLNARFVAEHASSPAVGFKTAYERAVKLMRSEAAKAFDLDDEPAPLRDAYGRNRFGQGCLLARRLVERGVPFIEVTQSGVDDGIGWDTHTENFDGVRKLSNVLDPAWATLMTDLQERGLLDSTLIVWMGEFGRTPVINSNTGRDHYPQAWSSVLAGGGIRGGQVVGRTSDDGAKVEDRPVSVPDLLATVCQALGIDPAKQNDSNQGRPIRIVDTGAKAIAEVVG